MPAGRTGYSLLIIILLIVSLVQQLDAKCNFEAANFALCCSFHFK